MIAIPVATTCCIDFLFLCYAQRLHKTYATSATDQTMNRIAPSSSRVVMFFFYPTMITKSNTRNDTNAIPTSLFRILSPSVDISSGVFLLS